jgi:hypothetical protein
MAVPSRVVSAARRPVVDAGQRNALDDECARLVQLVRDRCPGVLPDAPLGPGAVAQPVDITPDEARSVFAIAFAEAVGAPADPAGGAAVVWTSGDDELLVSTGDVRLVLADGFAIVAIHVYTEQTGDAQVAVPFALGAPGAPLGLVMGTESVPRGPALVVDRWGDQLQGAAWQALLHLAAGIAAAAGADDENQPLLPAALTVGANGVSVLPQARHTFDRSTPRTGA